jgi:hypothetical protein
MPKSCRWCKQSPLLQPKAETKTCLWLNSESIDHFVEHKCRFAGDVIAADHCGSNKLKLLAAGQCATYIIFVGVHSMAVH